MKQVSISIAQRVNIVSGIRTAGNMKQICVAKDLRKKMSFTQDEMKRLGLTFTDTSVTWNPEFAGEKFDYEFTEFEGEAIIELLTPLSKGDMITESMLELFEIFGIPTTF